MPDATTQQNLVDDRIENNDSSSSLETQAANVHRRDGWRAWFVCFCACVSNILISGSASTFGVIYPVLLHEFNQGKATTAWVGSLALFLAFCLSPMSAKLINRFGPRLVAVCGGILCALGLFMASFSTSIFFMYFSYGVVFGIGYSMTYNSSFDIVPKYFRKKVALALGIVHAGGGASFGMGLIFETLISYLGWRNMYRSTSGMALVVCFSSLSYSPHVEKDPPMMYDSMIPRETRIAAVGAKPNSLLKNYPYVICCIFSFFFAFGAYIPLIHLGRYAVDCGLPFSEVGNLYIAFGVSSVIGRIVSGKLCQSKRVNPSYLATLSAVMIGTAILCIQYAKDFVGLVTYFCVHGTMDGILVTANCVFTTRCLNPRNRIRGYGWFNQVVSWAFLLGPPFGGFIADQTGSYIPAFCTAGSITLLSGAIMMTSRCFSTEPRMEVLLEPTTQEQSCLTVIEKITVL